MIFSQLETRSFGRYHLHFPQIDSTNSYLKRRAFSLPDGTVVTAQLQTKGRGRFERAWKNDAGDSLLLSLLLRDPKPSALPLLPLLCGMAARQALEQTCPGAFLLKWPNDVLLDGKKVCGILCESLMQGLSQAAVAGIGVNLRQSASYFQAQNLEHACSLLSARGCQADPGIVASRLLNRLEALMEEACRDFEPLRREYRDFCVNLGSRVSFQRQGRTFWAAAQDIAADGGLICRLDDGSLETVYSGEVSVKGIYGVL